MMNETNSDNIYFSLDEAREEIKKRWNDVELKKKIEKELGDDFIEEFRKEPRAVLSRYVLLSDNSFVHFFYSSRYVNAKPLHFEYVGDKFTTVNEEKRGLGKIHLQFNDGKKAIIRIMDYKINENRLIKDVVLFSGEKMTTFYNNLFVKFGYNCQSIDTTEWNHGFGKPVDYYYPLFLHFLAHGVLFESFLINSDDENENRFTKEVVLPVMKKIKDKFNLNPIIVKLFPDEQTDEEDFFWWSYPSILNDYLIKYAEDNKLEIKIK